MIDGFNGKSTLVGILCRTYFNIKLNVKSGTIFDEHYYTSLEKLKVIQNESFKNIPLVKILSTLTVSVDVFMSGTW